MLMFGVTFIELLLVTLAMFELLKYDKADRNRNLKIYFFVQNNDINEFEKILKLNRETIMDDLFIREHIEDLLRNIRTQVS